MCKIGKMLCSRLIFFVRGVGTTAVLVVISRRVYVRNGNLSFACASGSLGYGGWPSWRHGVVPV